MDRNVEEERVGSGGKVGGSKDASELGPSSLLMGSKRRDTKQPPFVFAVINPNTLYQPGQLRP